MIKATVRIILDTLVDINPAYYSIIRTFILVTLIFDQITARSVGEEEKM